MVCTNGQVDINAPCSLRLSDDNFSDFLRIGQSKVLVGYIKTSDADNDFRFRRGSDNTDLLTIDFGDERLHFSGLDVTYYNTVDISVCHYRQSDLLRLFNNHRWS